MPRSSRTVATASETRAPTHVTQPPAQAPGAGQPADRPPVGDNPLLTDSSADQLLRERISRPAGGVAISPAQSPEVDQVVPNEPADPSRFDLADGSEAWADAATIRPEGTYLVGWTGEVVRLRTGGLAFLPVSKPDAGPEPVMALTPCGVYTRIENILGDQGRGLWLALTGEVLEYHGRNFLLPTAFTAATAPPAPTETPTEAPTVAPAETQPQAQPGTPAEAEPANPDQPEPARPTGDSVEDLVRQLEAERKQRRGIDTTFAGDGDDASADAAARRLDGRMLLSQRARMVRSSEGGWEVVIDNDDAGASADLPSRLRLLPCRVVARMESRAESNGESWDFEVSGQLYRHGASVYLLPRMFVTVVGGDVEPLQ